MKYFRLLVAVVFALNFAGTAIASYSIEALNGQTRTYEGSQLVSTQSKEFNLETNTFVLSGTQLYNAEGKVAATFDRDGQLTARYVYDNTGSLNYVMQIGADKSVSGQVYEAGQAVCAFSGPINPAKAFMYRELAGVMKSGGDLSAAMAAIMETGDFSDDLYICDDPDGNALTLGDIITNMNALCEDYVNDGTNNPAGSDSSYSAQLFEAITAGLAEHAGLADFVEAVQQLFDPTTSNNSAMTAIMYTEKQINNIYKSEGLEGVAKAFMWGDLTDADLQNEGSSGRGITAAEELIHILRSGGTVTVSFSNEVSVKYGENAFDEAAISNFLNDDAWYYDEKGNICTSDGEIAAKRVTVGGENCFEWVAGFVPSEGDEGLIGSLDEKTEAPIAEGEDDPEDPESQLVEAIDQVFPTPDKRFYITNLANSNQLIGANVTSGSVAEDGRQQLGGVSLSKLYGCPGGGLIDPKVFGTMEDVVSIETSNGTEYALEIAAITVDVFDGLGAQQAAGETFFVIVPEKEAMDAVGVIGEDVTISGDLIANQINGEITIQSNTELVVGDTDAWMAENRDFYDATLASMETVWTEVLTESEASDIGVNDWTTGITLLQATLAPVGEPEDQVVRSLSRSL